MNVIKGYWAHIPRSLTNPRVLKALCTYEYDENHMVTDLVDLGETFVIPREVFTDEQLRKLDCTVLRSIPTSELQFFQETRQVSPQGAKTERAQRVQQMALDVLFSETSGSGVVQVAPGVGKTALGFQIMQHWPGRTLVVCHTKNIQQNWAEEAKQLMGLPEKRIGFIGSSRKFTDLREKDLVIGLVQTLANPKHTEALLGLFTTVIYDEVHHMAGNHFRQALTLTDGHRIGLTATHERGGLENVFLHHIGQVIYRNDETDLDPEILFVEVQSKLDKDAWRRILIGERRGGNVVTYALNEVANSHINKAILHYVRQFREQHRVQLVLSDRLDQLKFLHQEISGSSILIGSTEELDRIPALNQYDVVCAHTSIALEGINRPELDMLHIALPWGSARKFVQGIGRITRSVPGKPKPKVVAYDPVDVPPLHSLFSHFKTRCTQYKYPRSTVTWAD